MAWTLTEWREVYFGPIGLLWIFYVAVLRTLFQAIVTFDIYHLVNPKKLLSLSFARGFEQVREGFREGDEALGVPAIVQHAHGVVVEIGAGIGNQVDRFDESKIKHIYGIEPNRAMVPALRAAADRAGLAGRYTIVPYGVEDEEQLEKAGIVVGKVDCVVSIQVLCSVPNPELVIKQMYKLLKPGGQMLVLEHLRCKDPMNRFMQRLYSPFWKVALDGCCLDRQTDAMLVRAGKWDSVELDWDNKDYEASLFPRVFGRLIKAKK